VPVLPLASFFSFLSWFRSTVLGFGRLLFVDRVCSMLRHREAFERRREALVVGSFRLLFFSPSSMINHPSSGFLLGRRKAHGGRERASCSDCGFLLHGVFRFGGCISWWFCFFTCQFCFVFVDCRLIVVGRLLLFWFSDRLFFVVCSHMDWESFRLRTYRSGCVSNTRKGMVRLT